MTAAIAVRLDDEISRTATQVRAGDSTTIHMLFGSDRIPAGRRYGTLCGDVLGTVGAVYLTTTAANCRKCTVVAAAKVLS